MGELDGFGGGGRTDCHKCEGTGTENTHIIHPMTITDQRRTCHDASVKLVSLLGVGLGAFSCSPQEGSTAFARLSEEAQDLIVRAFLGEFDDSPPPEMPDSVKAEIADWASKDEEENVKADARPKPKDSTT